MNIQTVEECVFGKWRCLVWPECWGGGQGGEWAGEGHGGRLGAEREGLGCQGAQLHFEVRPVLLMPSEQKPGHHLNRSRDTRRAACGSHRMLWEGGGGAGAGWGRELVGLKGQDWLCGGGGPKPAGQVLECGSTDRRGAPKGGGEEKRHRVWGHRKGGASPGSDPERRRLSLQTREELSSCSGGQPSCPRSSSSESYFVPQASVPPQPQGQGSGPGANKPLRLEPSPSWRKTH